MKTGNVIMYTVIVLLMQYFCINIQRKQIYKLENMINTFNNFKRTYTQRVIRLMKSAHIVD